MDIGILIPFFAIGGGLMIPISAIWLKHRERIEKMRIESTAQVSAERAAQYVGRVDELEERLRVLERIVTDRGYDVATQIEALRDQRRVEARLETADTGRNL
jgi:hypothetical protein